ncbi:hypothetical protein F4818DRAFT_436008 [Hypoxylon cercidicola]|nr:hypothetical protein F4818DRAFT_436008 [Hypoxylon cercidicola]
MIPPQPPMPLDMMPGLSEYYGDTDFTVDAEQYQGYEYQNLGDRGGYGECSQPYDNTSLKGMPSRSERSELRSESWDNQSTESVSAISLGPPLLPISPYGDNSGEEPLPADFHFTQDLYSGLDPNHKFASLFGPYEARLWRHEFAQNNWDDYMDAEKLLWEHITPMITHSRDSSNKPFPGGEVTYHHEFIRILRCRPYRFTNKVVNKWFDDRTILISDAAHVFPPFGGQDCASGLRDAHQLAWRIASLQGTLSSRLGRGSVTRALKMPRRSQA